MEFLNGQTATNFVIAVAIVGLALIAYAGVLKYLRERPVSPLMAITGRERAKRLAVIDAAVVDSRRRVVLIRRDNVEHLVLIGGPTDVVIESRIGLEEPTAAIASAAATAALQRRADVRDEVAEAPRRVAAPQRQAPPAPRPQPVPAPANNWEHELPPEEAEDDTYDYGPNAAFDAKDYPVQPQAQAYRPEPVAQAPAPANETAKQSAAAVAEANAESIIEMLRSRILNDAATTASMQAARQADASRRQVSTFERLLNERLQANDRQPAATPRAAQRANTAQAMPGVGPATARASAAVAQQLPVAREVATEKPRSEVALEMEVARILEELQTRRKQKQNP